MNELQPQIDVELRDDVREHDDERRVRARELDHFLGELCRQLVVLLRGGGEVDAETVQLWCFVQHRFLYSPHSGELAVFRDLLRLFLRHPKHHPLLDVLLELHLAPSREAQLQVILVFYFILFYFILFYFILYQSILF